jgi:hypothetical protein
LPLPVPYQSGFRVDVGYEKQKARYVFAEMNEDVIRLSETIDEPWIFLKVCAAPDDIKDNISKKWELQPQGYMMSCFRLMTFPSLRLPAGYSLAFDNYASTFVVSIVAQNGELASTGRVVIVNDLAVYDRIFTTYNHRRKGLASFLMKELQKIALSKGVFKNFLVATEEGKWLYQSLGWDVYCLYTSFVIPGA